MPVCGKPCRHKMLRQGNNLKCNFVNYSPEFMKSKLFAHAVKESQFVAKALLLQPQNNFPNSEKISLFKAELGSRLFLDPPVDCKKFLISQSWHRLCIV